MALPPLKPGTSGIAGKPYGIPPLPHNVHDNMTLPAPNTSGMSNDPVHDAGGGSTAATSVMAMQRFLNSRGFHLAVDGVRGPATNAAVLAFHNRNKGNPVPVANTPPAHTDAPGRTPAKVPKGKAGIPDRLPSAATPVVNPSTGQLIDPAAYASGAVNAQYNPQINELLRQLTQGRADEGNHTKQIQDWFSQAMGVQGDMAKANASAGQAAESAYNGENANILDLFGGPGSDRSTAAEANAFHDIGAGNLAADVNAQGSFDKNLRAISALSGAEAQKGQYNADQQGLKDLAGKLVDLRGAKGQAYSAAYQQGVQNRTQQEAAQQSLDLAKALAPSQIAQANANAVTARVTAGSAAQVAKTNLAIAQNRLKLANAQTAKILADTSSNGKWDLSHPDQQGAFQKALETNVYGPRGGLALNPETAWANLQQQLKMNGLSNDPQAQALAQGTFLQGLWTSHSLGNFGGFAWDGNKVVRTGNSYKVDKKSGQRSLYNKKGVAIPDYKPYKK